MELLSESGRCTGCCTWLLWGKMISPFGTSMLSSCSLEFVGSTRSWLFGFTFLPKDTSCSLKIPSTEKGKRVRKWTYIRCPLYRMITKEMYLHKRLTFSSLHYNSMLAIWFCYTFSVKLSLQELQAWKFCGFSASALYLSFTSDTTWKKSSRSKTGLKAKQTNQ